ncbi:MAG: hypothetical protein LCH81_02005 [Bacteroidetes bacterium]|nr:hypothetical protein [Bacteroidota bacterium]
MSKCCQPNIFLGGHDGLVPHYEGEMAAQKAPVAPFVTLAGPVHATARNNVFSLVA